MDTSLQVALSMGVPTLAVLIGILFTERLRRVGEVIDARLVRIENELKIR